MKVTGVDLVRNTSLLDLWSMLGGEPLRNRRGRAFWRGGSGLNVSVSESTGTWFDHVDNVGGGVLDLIAKVNGSTRAEALKWLAGAYGSELDGDRTQAVSKEDRQAYVRDLFT